VARLVAESAVVLVFARAPLQLLAHRQALLEAGLHRNLVS
jgi:hypothetical protein